MVIAVESFAKTVLYRSAGLNKLDLNVVFLVPPLNSLEVNSGPLSALINRGLTSPSYSVSTPKKQTVEK